MTKKIDLHLHLDGSIRPSTIKDLYAQKKFSSLPENTRLFIEDGMPTLTEYLDYFNLPISLIKEDVVALERIAYEMVEQLSFANVDYAEVRYAPQLLTSNLRVSGILEVMKAVEQGFKRGMRIYDNVKVNTIICLMRGFDHYDNVNTYEAMLCFPESSIVAIDLAGDEGTYLGEEYYEVFTDAKKKGFHVTMHAGESRGPESIKMAIDFGAERIGHGLSLNLDERLMDELAERKICLESCPISNFQTGAILRYGYNIKKFLDRGIHVTVNTDNMTVSNTNLDKEMKYLIDHYGFSKSDLELMQKYAEEHSFLSRNI